MAFSLEKKIGGQVLRLETGRLAEQAGGAVTIRYGDTVILATACMSPEPREGIDFLPLTIDYEERLYAAGKIPGGFFRREGRPSQDAILAARLTDRPLRPLFPKGLRNDVQVVITVLSADQENSPDILAINGASAALVISSAPFAGPVGAVRMAYVDGEYRVNPTFSEVERSALDIVVVGTRAGVMMVEAGATGVDEAIVLEAIRRAQEPIQEIIALQEELMAAVGQPKLAKVASQTNLEAVAALNVLLGNRLTATLEAPAKASRDEALEGLRKEVVAQLGGTYGEKEVGNLFDAEVKNLVRRYILEEGRRPDGRQPSQIRPISCEVGTLPRTHGSGLFTRGQTQVLTIATLGSMRMEQELDTLSPEDSKRFIHHYNFPPFSVGEVRRMTGPGRREVGHGALAERALEPVIPSEADFPYTIRLVSEVLSSNGSTSMASTCASSLALMDAGVPVRAPVAGVAMGLIKGENGHYVVLTDIQGMEDALGDMDFKVAGTAEGITAMQMDIKVAGISEQIMADALAQAKEARLYVLSKMAETISQARLELSPYAPRMIKLSIDPEKIRLVIGPGGKTIRSITEKTKVTIDVENDGTVIIGSTNNEAAQEAIRIIESLTKEAEIGAIYTGRVTRLMTFGAFVEILPGKEGLVHISELADYRAPSVEDVVKVGDEVMVMVTEIDSMGRINLSRRAVLEGLTEVPERLTSRREGAAAGPRRPSPGGGRPGGFRPGDRDRR